MINFFVTTFATLVGKIIGFFTLGIILVYFLKWRFKSWKNFEVEMKFWEEFLLKNIGISCMALIIIFLGFLVTNVFSDTNIISTEYLLSGIGFTVAFWYGYKKYEQDKEFEMLRKIQEGEIKINNFNEDIKKIAILYCWYKKGYLSKDAWDIIEIQFDEQFCKFLEKSLKFNLTKLDLPDQIRSGTKLISESFGEFYVYGLSLEKYGFMTYLESKLEDYLSTLEKKNNGTLLNENEKRKMDTLITRLSKISKKLNSK